MKVDESRAFFMFPYQSQGHNMQTDSDFEYATGWELNQMFLPLFKIIEDFIIFFYLNIADDPKSC